MDKRRKKVVYLMKEIIDSKNEIPSVLRDFFLREYGLQGKYSKYSNSVPQEEIDEIVTQVENMIENKCVDLVDNKRANDNDRWVQSVEASNDLIKACEAFSNTKSDYLSTNFQLLSILNEIIQFRQRYSENVKGDSLAKLSQMKILEKKIYFLKLQCFLKFYLENNAFDAHLELRGILTARLNVLKSQYKNLVQLDEKYRELKGNKTYCDLLKTYKDLLQKEKLIDYMIEE